jgi:antitoxin HigA-1
MTKQQSARSGVAPGVILNREIMAREWSYDEAAERLGCTVEEVFGLVRGEVKVDAGWARRLGRAFGTSVEVWVNLQAE